MAISNKKVIGWKLYKNGGIDHVRLIEFLKVLLEKKKNKLILMDNASSHRNPKVKQFILDSKNDYVHNYLKSFSHITTKLYPDAIIIFSLSSVSLYSSPNVFLLIGLKSFGLYIL